ncbi:hypothetical protein G6212_000858 [Salmonella enterica subsp. enterica]|nr:hypothetical protein [Salmonella enterica subsp. enterica serovar Hvittingfoss]
MTGNLFLKSDARMHLGFCNEDGNVRMYIYQDKGGDGVRINNGVQGGGDFVFGKNSEFYSPSHIHAGNAFFSNDGNAYGTCWGGYLSNWTNSQFAARDNNINTRATWGWVSQNFIQDVRLAAPVEYQERGLNEKVKGGVMTAWADYGGSNYHVKWRELQKLISGQWLTAAYT